MNIIAFSRNKLRDFNQDTRGNILIITALSLTTIIGGVGLAIDYSRAITATDSLNNSLDAAVIAAIATTTSEIQQGIDHSTAVNDGQAIGAKAFKANAGRYGSLSGLTSNITVTPPDSHLNITGTGSYSVNFPLSFGGLFHIANWPLAASATSTLKMPQYMNFYVMVDVSASMGAAATTTDETNLANINPDQRAEYPTGCTLACHFTTYKACDGTYCQGFIDTRPNKDVNAICTISGGNSCIMLRLDAIGMAMTNLLSTAQSTADANGLSSEFQIGIYPFIVHVNSAFQPLSTNLTTTVTQSAQQIPSLLDTGDSTDVYNWDGVHMGSGGTSLNKALTEMQSVLPKTPGDGTTQTNPAPFVILITDGAEDNQIMYNSDGAWSGSNHATVLTQSNCATLKKQATLAILYVPYVKILNPNPSFAGDEDDYANANIPNIPPSLQQCASPGFYYMADSPTDINHALQQIFLNALQSAPRLVN